MKAYTINKYTLDGAQLVDMPVPIVADNEVLVEVHATSVNLLDSKIKKGEFKLLLPYHFPLILGHDVAGIITQVGGKVKKFKVGDQIYSRPADFHIGTFAEYIAINEEDVALKPRNLTMEEAASIPLVALTAWQALVENAGLKPGQKVFIQAGSGGVGSIAIQLAKHLGASIATTSSAKSFTLVKELGAELLIDYKAQDFEDILKDYDVVLNSQDNKALEKSIHILKPQGRIISISGPPTPAFAREIALPWYLRLILSLISFRIRSKAKKHNVNYHFLFMKASGDQLGKIAKLIEANVIKPVVDKVYAFEDLNDALIYVEAGRAKGKVVVKVK